jgi:hemerythrin-like domain-containing protein
MQATEELKKEHEGIELMLRILQAVADKLERGEPADTEHLESILEFLSVFVDKCHHGKEEEFLFPALQGVGVLRENGPIGVMLDEHEQGRKLVKKFKESAAHYKYGDTAIATSIRQIIGDYVSLLTRHITKENTVLFPLAEAKLGSNKDREFFEAFEQLERDRIGVGKHEEFHTVLHQLQKTYLT